MICWCGKILEYLGGDCYSCPVHGLNFLKPKILSIHQISIGITGRNNIGCNIHKMRWCANVEITEKAHNYLLKKNGNAMTMPIKRNGEYTDIPIEESPIGTKTQLRKWLKIYNYDFDEIIKKEEQPCK